MFLLKPMQLLLITGETHIEGFVEKNPRRTNCLYLSYLKMILNSNSGASQG